MNTSMAAQKHPLLLLDDAKIESMIHDIGLTIMESVSQLEELIFIGILTHGVPLAERLSRYIKEKANIVVPVGKFDVSLYRDDILKKGSYMTLREPQIPVDLTDKIVILVDDVLFHGRTIRAAMDGLLDFGRPAKIELAVLIDRGHRELPIMANYIGKSIETNESDHIQVRLLEVDAEDSVMLQKNN